MDTMRRDKAENFCAIQSKLDPLLRNFVAQDKTVLDKTEKITGTRVDFVEPQRKKQELTPLPLINNSIGSGMTKTALKEGASSSAGIPWDSGAHTSVTSDVMVWANTWEMMSRTLETFATRNTQKSHKNGGKSRENFKKPKEFKDESDGCIDTWVKVTRLHLEQDNLNDERQA